MSQALEPLTAENEATYESLISLIENTQDRLALLIVACDDLRLRQRVIDRYESEAREAKIRSHRIVLGTEPSLRSGLAKLALQQGDAAVVTVTGAEWLLRVKTREQEQSDLDKFFGYLQWTREGLREFRVPIVLWVTHRILREMSRQAPDFWSWRKAVLRFNSQETESISVQTQERVQPSQAQSEDKFLPPLEELLSEIQQLESNLPESPNLATLYDQLGQVYARRIAHGEAVNLEQERQLTIDAFQNSISQYQCSGNQLNLVWSLIRLGNFRASQSHYEDAIAAYQQSLQISRKIDHCNGEAASLGNLGNIYNSLGQPQQAIGFYQQSLEIERQFGARDGEATSLGNLGNAYRALGQYQRAIELYQQSLEVKREIGDRDGEGGNLCNLGSIYFLLGEHSRAIEYYQQALVVQREVGNRNFEANSLGGLGDACRALGQYTRAISFYQQSLEIKREIGDRDGEANLLFSKALALAKYEPRRFEALATFKEARAIYLDLKLDHMIEKCDEAIYNFNAIIATEQPRSTPAIPSKAKFRATSERKINWILWFCVGIAIVLLIAWLRK